MEIMLALLINKGVKTDGQMPPLSFERATLVQRTGRVRATVIPGM